MGVADLAHAWWSWGAAATLHASILLAGAWLVDRAFGKRMWPQMLTTIWLVALARLLVPPWITSPWCVAGTLSARTSEVASAAPADAWAVLLASIWIGGALVCVGLRIVQRRALTRRIVLLDARQWSAWHTTLRECASALRLRRTIRIGVLADLSTPAVTGLFRATLLLPLAYLDRETTRRERHALLHELTHIQRGDLWIDELCHFIRALFWFHPLVWVAVSRVHALSELACDADVARTLGRDAPGYRETLVLAARDLLVTTDTPLARAFLGSRSQITTRLERLEQPSNTPIARVRLASAALASAMFACVLPMASDAAVMRANAQRVVDAQLRGERQSCFTIHAAAMVLAADASESSAPRQN